MTLIKQSTARNIMVKVFLTSDHVTAATGKTLTVTLSKDGAAFAAAGAAVTEIASGWYKIALTTTDSNTLGELTLRATAALCDDAERQLNIVAFDPQNATSLGLTNLATAVSTPPTVAAIRAEMDSNSTKLDATVSSRLASASYTVPPTVAAIRSELDSNSTKLDVATSTRLASASYSTPPTAAAIRSEIDSNSTKMDVATSTRLASASYTAPDSAATIASAVWSAGSRTLTDFAAVAADVWAFATRTLTDKTGFSLTTAPPTAIENADALLKRDFGAVTGEASRSLLNAMRAIRNKVSRTGSTITVTMENDTTAAWTAAIVTDAAAAPVTSVDPT